MEKAVKSLVILLQTAYSMGVAKRDKKRGSQKRIAMKGV